MSAKTNAHPGRRTPLSLSGSNPVAGHAPNTKQQQLNFVKQQHGGGNTNGNGSKNDKTQNRDVASSQQTSSKKQAQEVPHESRKEKHAAKTEQTAGELKKEQRSTRGGKKAEKEPVEVEEKKQAAVAAVVSSTVEKSGNKVESNGVSGAESKNKTPSKVPPNVEAKPASTENAATTVEATINEPATAVPASPVKPVAEPKAVTPKKAAAEPKPATTPKKAEAEPSEPAATPEKKADSVTTTTVITTTITESSLAAEPVPAAGPEDVEMEMEPLKVDASPIKPSRPAAEVKPTATSTPGKAFFTRSAAVPPTEVQLAMESAGPITPPRPFSMISGRRSFRPNSEYTPQRLNNFQSYRQINVDLDVTDVTNTSLNVTVGSERPNSSGFSFSFLTSGRKRDRTPPPMDTEPASEALMSPPKKARTERAAGGGLFGFMASPFTRLRNSFARTNIHGSSLAKEFDEVHNVSGVEDEEVANGSSDNNGDATMGAESVTAAKADTTTEEVNAADEKPLDADEKCLEKKEAEGGKVEEGVEATAGPAAEIGRDGDDIDVVEKPKQKNCSIM